MNKYEVVYVLNPTIGEEALQQNQDRIQKVFEDNNATITKTDVWGTRTLAYEIQDLHEGFYTVLYFEAEPTFPKELERNLKIMDTVLRYLVVRVEE